MRIRPIIVPIITGMIGIALAVVVARSIYEIETTIILGQFKTDVNKRVASFEREISLNFESIYAARILFNDNRTADHHEFGRVTNDILDRHPGIQALEWIPRVIHSSREASELSRRSYFPNFRFTERSEVGHLVRAQDRAEYFPVYFVAPLGPNREALGFDLASEPTRLEALNRAADTNKLSATGGLTLVQEKAGQKGFLCFLPVYRGRPETVAKRRSALRGFVLGVFRIGEIYSRSSLEFDISDVDITIIDDSENSADNILFRTGATLNDEAQSQHKPYRRELASVGGRNWSILAYPDGEYISKNRSWAPILVLLVGCLITTFVVTYIVGLSARAATVERLVSERTNQLQDALAKVKQLSGFLPICATCKKIRDDKGYWSQMETYITKHSEADFTHGICPDCEEEYYKELDGEGNNTDPADGD